MNDENQSSISPKKKSIGKNYFYNLLYKIFVLIIPLITTPYISRVLSPEGVGKYSFTYSITSYFVLLAALGFGVYAQREIAKHQQNKEKTTKVFYEILIVRFVSVSISVLLCIILNISGVYSTYSELMWWWVILIVAEEFDITFLYQGNEEFGKIAFRNILIKTVGLVLIFGFVKDASDVWLYVLCYAGSTFIGNISLWLGAPKYLVKIKLKELHPLKHLIPTIKLFIPTIATSVYTILDKTLIGFLVNDTYTVIEDGVEVIKKYSDLENGYYESAEKIVKVALAIVTSLGPVMIPRNSNEYANGNMEKLKSNIYFSSNIIWLLGVPLALGIVAVAPNMVPWFLGSGYDSSILLLQVFSCLIIFIGFSDIFGLQYLVPTNKDFKYALAIICGAISNLILNFILIPILWSRGAVIASIASEGLITIIMMLMIRREISLKRIFMQCPKYIIAGGVMFVAVYFTGKVIPPSIWGTVVLGTMGVFIYFILLIILRDHFVLHYLGVISKKVLKKCNK